MKRSEQQAITVKSRFLLPAPCSVLFVVLEPNRDQQTHDF